MVYNWRVERVFPVSAQVAGDFLSELERTKGKLIPKDVVDASRPADSVIHSCFEWNNDHAADLYRESQARKLMGNLVVVKEATTSEGPKDITVRAFVNVSQPESRYVSLDTAMSDGDMRAQVLQRAINELQSFRTKYISLSELAEVFEIIEKLSNED